MIPFVLNKKTIILLALFIFAAFNKAIAEGFDIEAGMDRKEGGHFIVKFQGGESAVAGHLVALLLEEAYNKVGSDLGYWPTEKVEAVLYPGERFSDITGSPSWAGALFDGRVKLPVGELTERTEALERVIFHEYTHAVVHMLSGGRSPTWLNEGIAQYEEGKRTLPFRDFLRELSLEKNASLKKLEGDFRGMGREEAVRAYVLSLSAAEYLVREFGIFSVRRVLSALGEGKSVSDAISSSIYLSYEDFEKSWLYHLERR